MLKIWYYANIEYMKDRCQFAHHPSTYTSRLMSAYEIAKH